MNEEDDKPTVVLDLNKLKEELKTKKGTSHMVEQDIEIDFSASPEPPLNETKKDKNIVFFELQGEDILSSLYHEASFSSRIINGLQELNKVIKEDRLNIVFYYGIHQKTVATLLKQINSKKLPINTILLAKNLSEQKAQAHKKTLSAAKEYLSYPVSVQDIFDKCI